MSKAEWGLKRVCPSCANRYYDMKKNPPVCPSCGTVFDAENLVRSRRGRPAPEKKQVNTPEDIEDIQTEAGGDDDDTLIEDADELNEEEVVEEVVDVEDED